MTLTKSQVDAVRQGEAVPVVIAILEAWDAVGSAQDAEDYAQ